MKNGTPSSFFFASYMQQHNVINEIKCQQKKKGGGHKNQMKYIPEIKYGKCKERKNGSWSASFVGEYLKSLIEESVTAQGGK